MSVTEYVNRMRVALARELLTGSRLDMERVAERAGYGSCPPAPPRLGPAQRDRAPGGEKPPALIDGAFASRSPPGRLPS